MNSGISFRYFILMASALVISFSSCNQDEEEEETESTPQEENQTANPQTFPDGFDGAMWAVKSVSITDTPLGPIETTIGLGVAAFINESGTDYIPAGTVALNGSNLTLNSNDTYAYIPSMVMPTGIEFISGVNWVLSGGNGIPAIDYEVALNFPEVSAITSSSTVNLASGYTLSTSMITGADSVFFSVGAAHKILGGNATTCNFSADELAVNTEGPSVVQIAAYTYTSEVFGDKTIFFGNEMVQTKSVNLQ